MSEALFRGSETIFQFNFLRCELKKKKEGKKGEARLWRCKRRKKNVPLNPSECNLLTSTTFFTTTSFPVREKGKRNTTGTLIQKKKFKQIFFFWIEIISFLKKKYVSFSGSGDISLSSHFSPHALPWCVFHLQKCCHMGFPKIYYIWHSKYLPIR